MKKIVCICRQFGTNKIKVDVDVTKEGLKVTCRGVFVENKDGRKLALFMPLMSQISLCDDFYNNNQSKFALLGSCYALPK